MYQYATLLAHACLCICVCTCAYVYVRICVYEDVQVYTCVYAHVCVSALVKVFGRIVLCIVCRCRYGVGGYGFVWASLHVVVCAPVILLVCMPTCYASQPRRPAAAAHNPGVDHANPSWVVRCSFLGLVPTARNSTTIMVPLRCRGILKYNYIHC